jgi:hypothetical protein
VQGVDQLIRDGGAVHWYPRSAVEKLMRRSTYPKVERGANGDYVLWIDAGVSQPLMERLTVDVEEHLAHATESGVDVRRHRRMAGGQRRRRREHQPPDVERTGGPREAGRWPG